MKTVDLINDTLDWAVAVTKGEGRRAKGEGYSLTSDGISNLLKRGNELLFLGRHNSTMEYSPSTDWSKAGPIIEREEIRWGKPDGALCAWLGFDYPSWRIAQDRNGMMPAGAFFAYGDTILIAAMRVYAVSRLGEVVALPEQLQGLLSEIQQDGNAEI